MPGCETTRAVFILRQLQKKYSAENKNFYCTFVELELAFDPVPRDAIWWVLKKLGREEWLVKIVQSMHRKARSCVGMNEYFSDDFLLQVELHQGSVLSPLLLIRVLEALSKETRSEYSEEVLYIDELALVSESLRG